MSFIYDNPFLIRDLLQVGLQDEQKFSKKGQTQPLDPAYTQQTTNFTNLHQLISNLENNLSPNAEATVSHEGDPSAQVAIRSENLNSLGALANWLLTNKIIVNGQRIVYSEGENPHNEDYQVYKLEPGGGLIESTDRSQPFAGAMTTFVMNKDLLSAYLVSLQAQQEKKPNTFLKVQLTKLIQETNRLLDTNINEQYKPPTQVAGTTGPNAEHPTPVGQGGNAKQQVASLEQLASMLPFNSEEINTRELKMFVDQYALLDPRMATLAQSANTDFQNIDSFMIRPGAPIQLDETTLTPIGFNTLARGTNGGIRLATVLYGMIQTVGRMYQLFVQDHLQEIANPRSGMGPGVAQSVQQQIAPGGPEKTNLGDLLQLIKNLQADFQHQRGQ
jgi:hypothetical protein